jgi:hypothetical protein
MAKETADSTKQLAQEKIGGAVCLRRDIAVSTRELKLGIQRLRTQVDAKRSMAAPAIRSWMSCRSRTGSR